MPISLDGVPPRSGDFLHFIVVGGGIVGLASAWSLRSAGHRVTLFEQQPYHVLSKCREFIKSPPTMNQIFNDWGIGDEVANLSTPIMKMTFLDGNSGEELGFIPINGRVMENLPASFTCLQYDALFRLFYDLANDSGVHLHFSTKVTSIDPWQGSVTCQDGCHLAADIIIGADGTESIVRPVVLGASVPPPESDDILTVSRVVPAGLARKDLDLAAVFDSNAWTVWLGDECALAGVLIGPGPDSDYSLVMYIRVRGPDIRENFPTSLDSLKIQSFEPLAQKLLTLSQPLSKTLFAHHQPFENWVHESGKVVLIGEAAHPMIPCGPYNISTGIEDAMALSMLFSLPATSSQTSMLLDVFEELRQPRCASMQRYIRRKRDILTIPHGPGQRKRDALLRDQRASHQGDDMNDEFLCTTYTGFVQAYGFDAREAVENWWVTLGRSISIRSPTVESEEEDEDDTSDLETPTSVPAVIAAEVERCYPAYPIISDPSLGDDDDIVRELVAHRRSLH